MRILNMATCYTLNKPFQKPTELYYSKIYTVFCLATTVIIDNVLSKIPATTKLPTKCVNKSSFWKNR